MNYRCDLSTGQQKNTLLGWLRSCALLFGLILLASCATQHGPFSVSPLPNHFIKAHWQEQGVLSYRDGKKGFSASYLWQNESSQYTVQVIAPLGAWRAKLLVYETGKAILTTSSGKTFRANNPLLLMQENLGWSIPVADLRYWLLAMPAPYGPFTVQKTPQHLIVQLTQADWSIHYVDYQYVDGLYVPEKIILLQGAKKITVVMQNFKVAKA